MVQIILLITNKKEFKMKTLKCGDCEEDISISSTICPKCGSKKQFKGHSFLRKEFLSKGYTRSDMMNFQRRGGKIKLFNLKISFKKISFKKLIVFVLVCFIAILVFGKRVPPEPLLPHSFEGTELKVTKTEIKLLDAISKYDSYDYEDLKKGFEELLDDASTRNDKDGSKKMKKEFFEKKFDFYSHVVKQARECISAIHGRDKRMLRFPDSYDYQHAIANIWTGEYKYVHTYKYTAANALGIEIAQSSRSRCHFDKDFNITNIEKLSF